MPASRADRDRTGRSRPRRRAGAIGRAAAAAVAVAVVVRRSRSRYVVWRALTLGVDAGDAGRARSPRRCGARCSSPSSSASTTGVRRHRPGLAARAHRRPPAPGSGACWCRCPLVFPSFVGAAAFLAGFAPGGVLRELLDAGRLRRAPPLPGPRRLVARADACSPIPTSTCRSRPAWRRCRRRWRRAPGCSATGRRRSFRRVVLPALRASVLGGMLLVFLYCLSEFGAVQLLGYDTLTRVVYATRLARSRHVVRRRRPCCWSLAVGRRRRRTAAARRHAGRSGPGRHAAQPPDPARRVAGARPAGGGRRSGDRRACRPGGCRSAQWAWRGIGDDAEPVRRPRASELADLAGRRGRRRGSASPPARWPSPLVLPVALLVGPLPQPARRGLANAGRARRLRRARRGHRPQPRLLVAQRAALRPPVPDGHRCCSSPTSCTSARRPCGPPRWRSAPVPDRAARVGAAARRRRAAAGAHRRPAADAPRPAGRRRPGAAVDGQGAPGDAAAGAHRPGDAGHPGVELVRGGLPGRGRAGRASCWWRSPACSPGCSCCAGPTTSHDASPRGRWPVARASALVGRRLVTMVGASRAWATYGARVTADEPQYLLARSASAQDGDLDIADEIEARGLPVRSTPLTYRPGRPAGRRRSAAQPHDPRLPGPAGPAGRAGRLGGGEGGTGRHGRGAGGPHGVDRRRPPRRCGPGWPSPSSAPSRPRRRWRPTRPRCTPSARRIGGDGRHRCAQRCRQRCTRGRA